MDMDTDLDATPGPALVADPAPEPAADDALAAPPRVTRPAVLALANDPQMRLVHDEVVYDPLPSDAALGALLFALAPEAVGFGSARYADRPTLQLALATARQFERVLARYVAREDRGEAGLPGKVTVADLRAWVLQAAKSVPQAEQERFCWRLARALGPDPWGDGSPAIELSGQQFALFETRFDEEGLPVIEPEPAPVPAPVPEVASAPDAAPGASAEASPEAAPAPEREPHPEAPPVPAKPKTPRAPRARKKPSAPQEAPAADGTPDPAA